MKRFAGGRGWLCAMGLLWGAFGLGCASSPPRSPARPPAKAKKEPELPGKVTGTGWRIVWKRTPTDSPLAPPQPVLIADARRGSLSDAESGSATIFLQDTRAQIFQQGQPAADILAPQITADQQAGTVLATGGVTVQARAKGENAVVTADRMLWNTRANTIIAVGNARLTRRPARGAPPITQTGGQITYDTARQEFVIAREEGAAP